MAKHFDKIMVYPEDKRLAKAAAGMKGVNLADYIGQRIREDSANLRDKMITVSEEHKRKQEEKKRGGHLGFF